MHGVAACDLWACIVLHPCSSAWLVWPLDAHDAVEQLALEGVGKLGVRGAAEELRVELERVVLRARLLVRPRRVVRDRRKGTGARGQAQGGRCKVGLRVSDRGQGRGCGHGRW